MAVFELVYQRIQGPRRRPSLPAATIALSDLKVLQKRKLLRVALFFMGAYALFFTGIVIVKSGMLNDYLPMRIPSDFLGIIDARFFEVVASSRVLHLLAMLMTLFAGSGRIAEDLRSGALSLYLAKPLTRLDYLLGKVGATAAVVSLPVLAVPALVYVVAALVDPKFLGANLRSGVAILVLGLLSVAYYTAAILFFSSVARSGRLAGLLFAGMVFVSGGVWNTTKAAFASNRGAFLGFAANLDTVAAHLLATTGRTTPALLPSLLAILAVTAIGLTTAHRRVRAVEVVR